MAHLLQTKPNQTKPNQTKPNKTFPHHFKDWFVIISGKEHVYWTHENLSGEILRGIMLERKEDFENKIADIRIFARLFKALQDTLIF